MKKIDFAILFFIVLFAYADTMRVPFMWDDEYIVKQNESINRLDINDFLAKSYWTGYRKKSNPFEIPLKPVSPLRTLSFRIDYKIYGLNPSGYHITNLLLHLLCVFLVYIISNKFFMSISEGRILSLFSACLFALNPIITETVIWIKNRIDLIATFFYLLSFLLFIYWRYRRKSYYFVLSVLSYSLTLFSKEIAITLPFILWIYVLCFEEDRLAFKKRIFYVFKILLPYILLTVIYLYFQKAVVEADKIAALTAKNFNYIWQHVHVVFFTFAYYIYLLIYPFNQVAERYLPIPEKIYEPFFLTALVFILAYLGLVFYIFRRNKKISFFMLWIVITLLPVSNIIYLSTRPIAEHRLYLPSIGFTMLMALGLKKIRQFVKKKYIYTIIVLLLFVSYAYFTMKRVYEWRNPISFWESTRDRSIANYRTYINLGISYLNAGLTKKAMIAFSNASMIMPDEYNLYNAIGAVYLSIGEYDKAEQFLKKSLSKYPQNTDALANLGNLYYNLKRKTEAIKLIEEAQKISPEVASYHIYLASIYRNEGDIEKAEKEYRKAFELDGYIWQFHNDMIEMYEKKGLYEKAEKEYLKAININPFNFSAYNGLGICYVHLKKYDEAKNMFKKALEIDPLNPTIKRNMLEIDMLKQDLNMEHVNKRIDDRKYK